MITVFDQRSRRFLNMCKVIKCAFVIALLLSAAHAQAQSITCTEIGNIATCSDSNGNSYTCVQIGNITSCS